MAWSTAFALAVEQRHYAATLTSSRRSTPLRPLFTVSRSSPIRGQRIGLLGTLESKRMFKRCRELVRDRLGVVWDQTRVRDVAEA
jgi:hypothetical protein